MTRTSKATVLAVAVVVTAFTVKRLVANYESNMYRYKTARETVATVKSHQVLTGLAVDGYGSR